jgi:hypothetical protein
VTGGGSGGADNANHVSFAKTLYGPVARITVQFRRMVPTRNRREKFS